MAIRETLDKIENLVAGASHVPLSGKCMIDENDLVHLVEELRNDLPNQLDHAEQIMHDRDKILDDAQKEAERIVEQAKKYAQQMTNENEIVNQAKEKERTMLQQAQEQQREIVERANQDAQQLRQNVDSYANQVFDQLITQVTNAFRGVEQTEKLLEQARQVLVQSKEQFVQNSNSGANYSAPPAQAQRPQ